MLVSRFLLDLQAASRHTLKLDPDDPLHPSTTWTQPSQTATLSFARVVGSLGSTLVYTASSRGEAEEDAAGVELGAPPGRRGLSVEDGGNDGPGEFVAADGARASRRGSQRAPPARVRGRDGNPPHTRACARMQARA